MQLDLLSAADPRAAIDRLTTHQCASMKRDAAYFKKTGRAFRACVNCQVVIAVHFAQFSHLCADCRRECTDASDVAPETCEWCAKAL